MNRVPHYLKANKGSELPQLAAWVDTETRPRRLDSRTVEHRLWFGWCAVQRRIRGGEWSEPQWFRFTKPAEFWTKLLSYARPRSRLYVFAHNWAFDAPVVDTFRQLPARGWKLGHCVIESPPVIMAWRKDSTTVTMLDTLNWWRHSLALIGESVGAPKLPMPRANAGRDRWDTYCRNDVEVIRTAVHRWWSFLARYDLGGFAPTLASQAFRTYRHRFMDSRILIDANPVALALARESYHGGRTEAFRIGRVKGPVRVFDVNSMYPFVMQTEDFPTVLKLHARRPTEGELRRWVSSRCVVARCRVSTKVPRYAVVRDGRLMFPIGRFYALLTTPDLRTALKYREMVDCDEVAVYDKAPIFRRFVDELYAHRLAARAKGDSTTVHQLKILMNSLYGKFGQRGIVWTKTADTADLAPRVWIDYDLDAGIKTVHRQIGGIEQTRSMDSESYSSHPAIAAHVTAYARAYLWSLITLAGREHVLYCDTDSVWVDATGAKRLKSYVSPDRLGALKLEATHDWVTIHSAKDYETPTGAKCKGVRKTARWRGQSLVEQEQWTSLAGLLRVGVVDAPRTTTVQKVLARLYGKGYVSRDGAVSPLMLREW